MGTGSVVGAGAFSHPARMSTVMSTVSTEKTSFFIFCAPPFRGIECRSTYYNNSVIFMEIYCKIYEKINEKILSSAIDKSI